MKTTDLRSDEKISIDFAKGSHSEAEFIEEIGFLGGTASKVGSIPYDHKPYPRTAFPRQTKKLTGETYVPKDTAPDVVFHFPKVPVISYAQVKAKKLYRENDGSLIFWLDEDQLFKMNRIAQTGAHVVFVVHCEELEDFPGLSPFSFVHVRDLQRDKAELHKVKMRMGYDGNQSLKPTFKLPLALFRPLSELEAAIYEHSIPFPNFDGRSGAQGSSVCSLAA